MLGLRVMAVLVVLLAVLASGSVSYVRAVDMAMEASSAVEGAEAAVVEAYGAVWEAAEAGANVTALLGRLDAAGEYLALARMCLRTGNVEGAVGNARLSVEALDGLVEDAGVLRGRAVRQSVEGSWMALGGSIGGMAAIVCGGWLSWSWFKKRYNARALEMRPEVAEDES